jgi:hypothetical protein
MRLLDIDGGTQPMGQARQRVLEDDISHRSLGKRAARLVSISVTSRAAKTGAGGYKGVNASWGAPTGHGSGVGGFGGVGAGAGITRMRRRTGGGGRLETGSYLSASALAHQQHLRGPSSVSSLFGPAAAAGSKLAQRSGRVPPAQPCALGLTCIRATHLLFEHRGHPARQLACLSTPRGPRVSLAHGRGCKVWGQGVKRGKNNNNGQPLHQTRGYRVYRLPHRAFRPQKPRHPSSIHALHNSVLTASASSATSPCSLDSQPTPSFLVAILCI